MKCCNTEMVPDRPYSPFLKCTVCYKRVRIPVVEKEPILHGSRIYTAKIRVKGKEITVRGRASSMIVFQRYIAVKYYGLRMKG